MNQESPMNSELTITEMNINAVEFRLKYEIVELLGTGSFGAVFQCRRLSDNAVVAVKRVPREHITTWSNLDGKIVPMEIAALTKLSCVEGVVKILDFYDLGKFYMIVMESDEALITFKNYLTQETKIDEREAKIHMKILISILNCCHEKGIAHRDIKPSNILIDPITKKLLLIDFGNAEYIEKEPFFGIRGTKLFYPPESFNRGPSNSDNISVWSLGVTLYNMVCGKLPFLSEKKIKRAKPFFYEYMTPLCQDFLRGCFNKDVERRLKLKELLDHPFLSSENE